MSIRSRVGKLATVAAIGWITVTMTAFAQGEKMTEQVQESGYTTPFSLQHGGEKIDVMVRVKDKERGYYFYLVFVEKQDSPQEKKDHLRRLYQGSLMLDANTTPYPVKLRFQLDSVDGKNGVHIDKVVSERDPIYGTRYAKGDTEIWRAHSIHYAGLEPGVYRVRIENLVSAPEIDFETLFQFERDNRKY